MDSFGARFDFASVRLGSWMCMPMVFAYFVLTSSNLGTNWRAAIFFLFFSKSPINKLLEGTERYFVSANF
jgi:hypothetical protein